MNDYDEFYHKKCIIRKKKVYCANCGKYGHTYKKCNEPITSLGIITFKLDSDISINDIDTFTDKYINKDRTNINILKNNNRSYNNFKYINLFKDKIKFLMIRRKHTLGYIEFIRGRYDQDDIIHITSLFEQMTPNEINTINTNNFDDLWNKLWKTNSKNKKYENEFKLSKEKFNYLKTIAKYNINFYAENIKPAFDIPEWGFPKGRRNYLEKNIECAKREFFEETGLYENEYNLLTKVVPLNEIFKGTNGILYKHTYFLGLTDNNIHVKLDDTNIFQTEEIGDIGWFTFTEAKQKIRPYHTERQKVLNELYLFIIDNIIRNNSEETVNNDLDYLHNELSHLDYDINNLLITTSHENIVDDNNISQFNTLNNVKSSKLVNLCSTLENNTNKIFNIF